MSAKPRVRGKLDQLLDNANNEHALAERGIAPASLEAKLIQEVLYWKTRAEQREMLATYDNLQSLLTALMSIGTIASEKPDDLESARELLKRIRFQARIAGEAIYPTVKQQRKAA